MHSIFIMGTIFRAFQVIVNLFPIVICSAYVTDDQLKQFSEALINVDQNTAQPILDVQQHLYNSGVYATKPLFQQLAPEILKRPTYFKFIKLLDNYYRKVEVPEDVTQEEKKEMDDFLISILSTPVMKKTQDFLIQAGKLTKKDSFATLLYDVWFKLYPRFRDVRGSSGFEHVFVGEIKNQQVSGLHNWIQHYLLEKNGNIKYHGYTKILTLKKPIVILKYQFAWNEFSKPSSTMFIGTSPEFEIGLYTVCFYLRPNNKCPISIGGKNINIETHLYTFRGYNYIGSAYPTF